MSIYLVIFRDIIMLFKEKGYDEFLTQQIQQGKKEFATRQGIPFEQVKAQIHQTIEKSAKNLIEQDIQFAHR